MKVVIKNQQLILLFNESQKTKLIILLNLIDDSLIQIRHIQHSYNI